MENATTRRIFSRGTPYIKDNRFYGIFNAGEWAYYDPENSASPWKFVGGVASLVAMERLKLVVWYTLVLPSGRRLYLPKLNGKFLTFVYDGD